MTLFLISLVGCGATPDREGPEGATSAYMEELGFSAGWVKCDSAYNESGEHQCMIRPLGRDLLVVLLCTPMECRMPSMPGASLLMCDPPKAGDVGPVIISTDAALVVQ